jgi:hypothetical protein
MRLFSGEGKQGPNMCIPSREAIDMNLAVQSTRRGVLRRWIFVSATLTVVD